MIKITLVTLLAYLLGSFSPSYFISKAKGIDLRSVGSGNLGASNTKVALGWGYGILVAVVDISKAAIAVLICRYFLHNQTLEMIACVSAVIGHMFPFYLGFKGGKGYASYTGGILMINVQIALWFILAGIIITLVTRYIALATIASSIAYPAVFYFLEGIEYSALLAMIILAAIIVYKHKDNVVRICNGEEIPLYKLKKEK